MSQEVVRTSVIIPVYNDPEGLRTTVESLLDQTAEDYEIVIADNGSTDETRQVANEFAQDDRVTLVVEDEIQGSYAARNAGIETSKGNILCFIDADMWVDEDWLERVQDRMRDADIDYLGCDVEIVVTNPTPVARYNRQHGFPIEEYIEANQFAPTCCLVTRRGVIEDVGLFDERLISSGDAEFGKRVHDAGYSQYYAPDITMYHPARETLRSFLKKYYRIARGRVQRARYYPELFEMENHPLNPRNFLPIRPWAVYESHDGSLREFLIVYTILTAVKITTGVGEAREWLWPTRD